MRLFYQKQKAVDSFRSFADAAELLCVHKGEKKNATGKTKRKPKMPAPSTSLRGGATTAAPSASSSSSPTRRLRRPATLVVRAGDKMCRDVVSTPKDRPVVEGTATVRFLGAGGKVVEIQCNKVGGCVCAWEGGAGPG